jgi:Ca-activated chloride channel family protein
MRFGVGKSRLPAASLAVLIAFMGSVSRAEEPQRGPCTEDAMIVFDASGSMAGNENFDIGSPITRIDEVKSALASVLPSATRWRRVGLITFGPGPYNQCNVQLNLEPTADAASAIMRAVNALNPAGRTPLTSAVEQAANVLDFRHKPGIIVVVTDGEETCNGSPCELGKKLHAEAQNLAIHVIGFRVEFVSWTGAQGMTEARCLAEQNNGLYISAKTEKDLIDAFRKTLDCPMLSESVVP